MDDFVGRITEPHLLEEMSKLTSAVFDGSDLSQVSVKDALDSLTKAEGLCRFTGHELEVSRKFDSSVRASSHFSEYNAMKMMESAGTGESLEPRGIYVSWMPLLFSTYLRFVWVPRTNQKVWYWLKHHTVTDISPARFVTQLDAIAHESASLADFAKWFVENYVIDQARRVYQDKNRSIYSRPRCWFHREGDRYVRDREYEPRHRNMRFGSATTILEDLGLITIQENTIELTSDGRELLARLGAVVSS